jgi:hypothetical protein
VILANEVAAQRAVSAPGHTETMPAFWVEPLSSYVEHENLTWRVSCRPRRLDVARGEAVHVVNHDVLGTESTSPSSRPAAPSRAASKLTLRRNVARRRRRAAARRGIRLELKPMGW